MDRPLAPDQILQYVLGDLEESGFRRQAAVLRVVELSFTFDAVYLSPGGHDGLTLVIEQPEVDVEALLRRLHRLALALINAESRRPVTLILVSEPLSSQQLDEIRPLVRLIPVDRVAQDASEVDDVLREFHPLVLENVEAQPTDAGGALATELGTLATSGAVAQIMGAAPEGVDAVDALFRDLMRTALADYTRLPV